MGRPQQREPSGGERRWRSVGAAEGAGNGFEGALDDGAELGVPLGG
jgi:hypothetical protein